MLLPAAAAAAMSNTAWFGCLGFGWMSWSWEDNRTALVYFWYLFFMHIWCSFGRFNSFGLLWQWLNRTYRELRYTSRKDCLDEELSWLLCQWPCWHCKVWIYMSWWLQQYAQTRWVLCQRLQRRGEREGIRLGCLMTNHPISDEKQHWRNKDISHKLLKKIW